MENILHTFRDCKLASDTLDHIFAAWHTATGETLDNKCIRTVIFGDRQPKQSNTSPELEEPYRMIQAHLMHSLWRARCQRAHPDTRRGKELRSTTAAILQDIRTGVQAQLTCRYEEAREMNLVGTFHTTWVRTGIARMVHGKPIFQLLDRDTFYPPKGARENHWYVDGSAWRV